ncbi:hypothetical protein [Novosphingobium huizhouense]|uniref:hypothetical protein n=1 Tax=Novosphingobium huizhouense TaxID=2866625 RepID=UPI001CD8E738|nr:hypothetical protein [Novosphingobium huizhouense]
MRRLLAPLAPLALAACSNAPQQSDAAAIAQVEAAQKAKPPARALDPQPIGYFDIKDNGLIASGCNFVADGGGMGATALAQGEHAAIKLDGKIVTLAADKGSTQLPQGAWSHYTGTEFALSLARVAQGKHSVNGVVEMFEAHLTITDPHDQVVYDSNGTAQCKPM